MAKEDRSFADLVAEAPAAPAAGTVSLVGALAKSSEAGKFTLTLQDGRTVTLETAAVKGHAVLGVSLGLTIVRIEVEAEKVPAISPQPFVGGAISPLLTAAQLDLGNTLATADKVPATDNWKPVADKIVHDNEAKVISDWNRKILDDRKDPLLDGYDSGLLAAGGVMPFALATPHQAPANLLAALSPSGAVSRMRKLPGVAEHTYPPLDATGTSYWGDMTVGPGDMW